MENLTGHEINIVGKKGEVLFPILPSKKEVPLRANFQKMQGISKEGYPIVHIEFFTELSQERLDELAFTYREIIVSKITAEALKAQGYKGSVYITGPKVYSKSGKLLGVTELSKYI